MIKNLMLFICFNFFSFILVFTKERLPSYPFISGDGFRFIADHVLDEDHPYLDPNLIQDKDLVFVKTEFLEIFFSEFFEKIKFPFILITHNSDLPIPGIYKDFLDKNKLIRWFGQNIEQVTHHKLEAIPIGITNRYNKLGDIRVYEYFLYLSKKKREKEFLAFFSVTLGTCYEERIKAFNYFSNKQYCYTLKKPTYPRQYFKNLLKSHFIISPRGNGLDCHRTWEALYFGAIPVVKSSYIDPLFDDLPVLIIDNWSEINEKKLIEFLDKTKNKTYHFEKLFFSYWQQKIFKYKN